MGCFSSRPSPTFKTIRVVHLNGYVEDFNYPISAGEVTGKQPKHFVCTWAQLVVYGGPKSLRPNTQLESGQIYFLLPFSTIQPDVSPVELASIAKKLTRIAKIGLAQSKPSLPGSSSPARSPSRFSHQPVRVEPENNSMVSCGLQRSTTVRSWKPILGTIREMFFNRRSESKFPEIHFDTLKDTTGMR